jgi:hypothetical protein
MNTSDSELEAMLADIAQEPISIDDSQMTTLANLATQQNAYEQAIEVLDARRAELVDRLKQVQEVDIPELMDEMGVQEFTLTSGRKVSIRKQYYASIPKDKRDAAFAWLTEHGHEELIKVEVEVQFGRGEFETAVDFARRLAEAGYNALPHKDVNAQTLKAWVKRMIESDEGEFPMELFNPYIQRKAIIK